MKKFIVFILLVFFSICPGQEYYLNKASTGSGDGTTQALSGPNAAWKETAEITGLTPDDTIFFNKGDTWTAITSNGAGGEAGLTIPTSGSSGNIITFDAYGTGDDPLIDVNSDPNGAYGIYYDDVDYILIQNIDVRGSGNAGAVRGSGTAGSAGDGYTFEIRNVDILSNWGASTTPTSTHDGFSQQTTSEVNYFNITATNCSEPNGTGSDGQCFTLHALSKANVYTANFSESISGITNTSGTTAYFEDVNIHNMIGGTIIGLGGIVDFNDGIIVINTAASYIPINDLTSEADSLTVLTIRNSTMVVIILIIQ